MERSIGILGQEIRLHSNPYSNLIQIGIERAAINALVAKYPELEKKKKLPPSAIPLPRGYVLLHPHDIKSYSMPPVEYSAYVHYAACLGISSPATVYRHARLCLPNGHLVRSLWKEAQRLESRVSRMVKVC
jgi:hypothetical protein